MSWFLTNQYRSDSELSSGALLAAGKSLYVANDFETTCKHILFIAELTDSLQSRGDVSVRNAIDDFCAAFRTQLLHQTIRGLGKFPDMEQHITTLDRARVARNFIAHEGAHWLAANDQWLTIARLKALREEVRFLAHGANLVSLWSYEIENKERGPSLFFDEYPDRLDQWVFGHLTATLDRYDAHPKVKRAEETLSQYGAIAVGR